jgi:hypothetical protein
MKVKDLLKELYGVDPEREVVVFADHHGHYTAWCAHEGAYIDDDELIVFNPDDKEDADYIYENYVEEDSDVTLAFIISG